MDGPVGGSAGAANISPPRSATDEDSGCEAKLFGKCGDVVERFSKPVWSVRVLAVAETVIASIGKVEPGIATISSVATICLRTTFRVVRRIGVAFVRPDTPTSELSRKIPKVGRG
jgi:hypothetical protein